jgi:undecaprenyl diphosphate synthase
MSRRLKYNAMDERIQDRVSRLQGHDRLPVHIAIIMDGNGRWAERRGLPRTEGHNAGVKAVRRIVEVASEIGIKYLTLYTFSIENWQRPKREVASLMRLLSNTTRAELNDLIKNNVRLIATGRIDGLPAERRQVLKQAIRKTSQNDGLTLNLALNYGGRTEILDAVREIVKDVASGKVSSRAISERLFEEYLYTAGIPDPDLLIRTSGEYRLSNFLIWQTSYTEMYVTETLWPDFEQAEFLTAIEDYLRRERRFGGVREK